MKAVARVLDVDRERARLECDAATASCPACRAGGGCALQRLVGRSHARLEIPALAADGWRLEPGSKVTVEVEEGALLGAAARTYLPPLAGLLAGPVLAGVTAGADELPVLISALAGVLLGWAVARIWLRRAPPRISVRPVEESVNAT